MNTLLSSSSVSLRGGLTSLAVIFGLLWWPVVASAGSQDRPAGVGSAALPADVSGAKPAGASWLVLEGLGDFELLSHRSWEGSTLESRASREVERIITSPLTRLPRNARARGWGELGLFARPAGDATDSSAFLAVPFGAAYYRLADPIYVTLELGVVGLLSFEDEDFEVDAYIGNPYFGVGVELPVEGLELQLLGGLTLPLATTGGAAPYALAQSMRSGWSPWLWAPRRLSAVFGTRADLELDGPVRVGGEVGAAPMVWFGEGSRSTELALQGSLQASVVLLDVVDVGLRGLGARLGDLGTQVSTEIFANVQGDRQRIYHGRLTLPLLTQHGDVGDGHYHLSGDIRWALHLGAGLVF